MKTNRARNCALVLLMSLSVAVTTFADDYTLTVLHTNDVHSHLDVDDMGRYGSARVKAVADSIKAEKPDNVMVDAGDLLVGTIFFSQFDGTVDQVVLNMMGYDAITLGNHEFDKGPSILSSFIDNLQIPVVSSNVDFPGEPLLNGKVIPYYIKEVGASRVGFIGATLTSTLGISNPGQTIVFNDEIESLSTAVQQLRTEDVNIIIAITHVGFTADKVIAGAVDGIDIIVGGHSHSLLSNDKYGIAAYPTVVNSPSGDPVLVVQAGSYNKYLGELDVTFNKDGVPVMWTGNPIYLDAGFPLDEDVAAYIAKINEDLLPMAQKVIGRTEVELTREWDRESALGNLITDAMLEYMRPQGVQIALTNNGGIRSAIPEGDITLGSVMKLLPFGNTMATFEIKGSDLWQTFDHGVSRALGEDIDGSGGNRFLHNSGAIVTWDPTLPKFDYKSQTGGRVVSVKIDVNGDGKYVDLDLDATYKVVSNNYIRGGGDGFLVLAEKAIDPYDEGALDVDVLTAYLEDHSPVNPVVEGRVVRFQEPAVEMEKPTVFSLSEPYPNPFNPSTTISYCLPGGDDTRVEIFDVTGQIVAILVNEWRDVGQHSVVWDASDQAAGLYFCRVTSGANSGVIKMMLVK